MFHSSTRIRFITERALAGEGEFHGCSVALNEKCFEESRPGAWFVNGVHRLLKFFFYVFFDKEYRFKKYMKEKENKEKIKMKSK